MTRSEIKRMIKAGVVVRHFGTPTNFFQFMAKIFRTMRTFNVERLNHGKTLVIDGWYSFTGGYNWMSGQTTGIKSWRDTDFYISGPIAQRVTHDFYSIFDTLPKLTKESEQERTVYRYSKTADQLDEFFTQAP